VAERIRKRRGQGAECKSQKCRRAEEQKGFKDSRVQVKYSKYTEFKRIGFKDSRVQVAEESSEKLIIQRIQGVSCKVSWIDVF
jgi:hypothetical protein